MWMWYRNVKSWLFFVTDILQTQVIIKTENTQTKLKYNKLQPTAYALSVTRIVLRNHKNAPDERLHT